MVGQGFGDDGGNDNKVRGNILSITPLRAFIASGLELNRDQNWNRWGRNNTKRRKISTPTGNHPRMSTRSISRRSRGYFNTRMRKMDMKKSWTNIWVALP